MAAIDDTRFRRLARQLKEIPKGETGETGAKGSKGEKGETGTAYRHRGDYAAGTAYVNDASFIDCVAYEGSTYYAKTNTAGNPPTDETCWGLLARKGDTGDVAGPSLNTDGYIPQWDGANANKLKDGLALSADGTLAGNSDGAVPTQKAVKTYADTKLPLSGGTLTGNLIVSRAGNVDSFAVIDGTAGYYKGIRIKSGDATRWDIVAENNAEGGSNAGSDLIFRRYNDAGTYLENAVKVKRADGFVGLGITPTERLHVSGNLKVSSGLIYPASGYGIRFADLENQEYTMRSTGDSSAANLSLLKDNSAATPFLGFDYDTRNVIVSGGSGVANGGGYNSGHLVLGSFHLWIDTSGRLRIKSSAPTSATDGTAVGAQS
jgi:hypothetical protein